MGLYGNVSVLSDACVLQVVDVKMKYLFTRPFTDEAAILDSVVSNSYG